jgi:hypothetical protein
VNRPTHRRWSNFSSDAGTVWGIIKKQLRSDKDEKKLSPEES